MPVPWLVAGERYRTLGPVAVRKGFDMSSASAGDLDPGTGPRRAAARPVVLLKMC